MKYIVGNLIIFLTRKFGFAKIMLRVYHTGTNSDAIVKKGPVPKGTGRTAYEKKRNLFFNFIQGGPPGIVFYCDFSLV